jgi:hypothetical protein
MATLVSSTFLNCLRQYPCYGKNRTVEEGRVPDDGDDPQPAPTAGTGEDIEGEHGSRWGKGGQLHGGPEICRA